MLCALLASTFRIWVFSWARVSRPDTATQFVIMGDGRWPCWAPWCCCDVGRGRWIQGAFDRPYFQCAVVYQVSPHPKLRRICRCRPPAAFPGPCSYLGLQNVTPWRERLDDFFSYSVQYWKPGVICPPLSPSQKVEFSNHLEKA